MVSNNIGGILKNKNDSNNEASAHKFIEQTTKEFRDEVLKNTKLNSQLTSTESREPININSNATLANINTLESNPSFMNAFNELSEQDKESLKWDIKNLKDNSIIQKKIIENMKSQGQMIEEPKTPFQGAQELNEYYKDDGEFDEELEGFSLGEPVVSTSADNHDHSSDFSLNDNDELTQRDEDQDMDDDEEEEEPKQKMTFAEMRKMHYHNERVIPSGLVDDDDDDDDDDDTQ